MTASAKPPVFIIGVHRSGTSLLNMMLDGSSELWIPYESHFIAKLRKKYPDDGAFASRDFRRSLIGEILDDEYVRGWEVRVEPGEIDPDRCLSFAGTIDAVYAAHAARAGKTRWGDKTPSYVMHADLLNALFPECRFVHLVRDGRDVAASVVRQHWGENDYVSALKAWARKAELAERMLAMLPASRRMTLRYEDLVARPEENLKKVCAFLELEYEPAMLSYQQRSAGKVGRRIQAHHANLLQAPRTDLALKWKRTLPPVDQAIAEEVAGGMLAEFGYDKGRLNHPFKGLAKLRHRLRESRGWRNQWRIA
jgi:hypothetical protein